MTIITYSKNYRTAFECDNWILYSNLHFNDSLIVWALYNLAKKSEELNYQELYIVLQKRLETKTEKSSCNISKTGNRIDIIVKGVFPIFYIEKKS